MLEQAVIFLIGTSLVVMASRIRRLRKSREINND